MNRDELYGSARWARAEEIAAAGLHDPKGLYFGQSAGGKPLRLPFDMPLITFGGAGSGKGRDVILHNVLTHPGHMFITDPKGELAAVATQGQGTRGKAAYCINPYNLHPGPPWCLPSHAVNPLDVLKADSPSLAADAKLIMEMLVPMSQSGERNN